MFDYITENYTFQGVIWFRVTMASLQFDAAPPTGEDKAIVVWVMRKDDEFQAKIYSKMCNIRNKFIHM